MQRRNDAGMFKQRHFNRGLQRFRQMLFDRPRRFELRRLDADNLAIIGHAVFELRLRRIKIRARLRQRRLRLRRNDQTIAWMEILASRMTGGGNVGTLYDVTAVKESEDELRKLSLVASFTDNYVIIADREGRTEWVNQAFVRRTGYTLEDMLGRKPGRVLQGPGTNRAVVDQISQGLREGKPISGELLNYTRNGEGYWVRFHISPVRDATGQVERFVSVQTDSTEQHRVQSEIEAARDRAEFLASQAQAANRAKSEFLAMMSHEIRKIGRAHV